MRFRRRDPFIDAIRIPEGREVGVRSTHDNPGVWLVGRAGDYIGWDAESGEVGVYSGQTFAEKWEPVE